MITPTALIIITFAWAISVAIQGLPSLFAPISRHKRSQILGIAIITGLAVFFAWIGITQLHAVSGFSLLIACVVGSFGYILLKRLDYYVEELLREIMLVVGTSSAVSVMTSLWFWGIEQNPSLIGIRIAVAIVPLVIFAAIWFVLKERSILWMMGIYVFILVIKTIFMPWWLIWTPILSLLFAVLAGYTVYWQLTTTSAEKIFSLNVDPTKIWLALAGLAGLLVLAF